ncbi:Uncharacterized protein KIAA1751, partial [Eurypyga helias]
PKQLSTRVVKKENFEKKMEEFRTGIFQKPIVSHHECKGGTFYSRPSCIHFKDFDVGQVYIKKIVLINASYRINCCRLVGISEWLKDFISVRFDPPGKIATGMSREVVVTFKPTINTTLEGEVMFLSKTGPFSVPLKCTAKRCILALDKELIDFGSHVVGERISRTINLTNSGALGTRFKVQTSADDGSTCKPTVKSSPKRMVELQVNTSLICDCLIKLKLLNGYKNKQLGQDVLNSDTANAHNLVELSPEETPVEIMLGKVTEGEIGPFSSAKLEILFVPAKPGHVRAEFVIVFDNSDCKPVS